ncbi:MAG: CDP-diacylglycerol--serine O-phosphatidyltransferase [Burkholderiaceae bacterium]|jgi:CDP-diacylglycerol--serine O-phosphatidyltransferase|nr:CDP-diacylglycerol--serine O-phosphatidyltransferase [Burkholderiaceae bacterium]
MKPLKPPYRKGIYLLPNMITISALFCGFYAVVMSLNLEFKQSTVAIFIGMILDSMDGRVARLTHTQSEFGAQLDSLSDMVTFGVAPALVAYEWSLKGMGRVGWVAAFIYCACAALRLARFNTNIAVVDKRFFQGLPSPAAAAIVAGFIWLMDDMGFFGRDFYWTCWWITLYAGLTMVTNVPFYSFKEMNIRKSVPFIVVIVLVLIVVTVSVDPPKVLFGLFVLYGVSGYIVYVWHKFQGRPVSIVQTEEEGLEAPDSKSG